MADIPLLARIPSPMPCLPTAAARPSACRDFLRDAMGLAARLPQRAHILNLCADRYRFAGRARRCAPAGTDHAAAAEPHAGIHPAGEAAASRRVVVSSMSRNMRPLARWMLPELSGSASPQAPMPHISSDQLAAIVFTSGSTGAPMPHRKTWGVLTGAAGAEIARLGLYVGSGIAMSAGSAPAHVRARIDRAPCCTRRTASWPGGRSTRRISVRRSAVPRRGRS